MPDGQPQTWDIPLTPAQRWILLQLSLSQDAPQVTDAAGGKAMRRALRAFGLMPIRDVLRVTRNTVSKRLSESSAPALHKITAENRDYVLGLAKVPRPAAMELDAGDVFDVLERLVADPGGWAAPGDLPFYTPDVEDWHPEKDAGELVACPHCGKQLDAEAAPA